MKFTRALAGQRLECKVLMAARLENAGNWRASMEMPPEYFGLDLGTKLAVINSMDDKLAELRRLTALADETGGVSGATAVLVYCGLWLRRCPLGVWRVSVNFAWPESWLTLSPAAQGEVLCAIQTCLISLRQTLSPVESGQP